ncbi:MAG TPA: leucyl aminopeptidase [Nitrososphaeraceae archaeon]|nr:leucyl aminopeptidase [Nitrososphaeraceae archaeon]
MVKLIAEQIPVTAKQTSLLVLGVYENEVDDIMNELVGISKMILELVQRIVKDKEHTGSFGSSCIIHCFTGPIQRIMLLGLGEKKSLDKDKVRVLAGKAAAKAMEINVNEYSIKPFTKLTKDFTEAVCEGTCLSLYKFDQYQSKQIGESSRSASQLKVSILVDSDSEEWQRVLDTTKIIIDAVNFGRDLANLPPNDCSPEYMARVALDLSSKHQRISTRIIERYEMESLGLNGIVAVGMGSNKPPKLVIIEYRGNEDSGTTVPYLFVGKAVTFDTGGISIKPSERMEEMKFDKTGGCDVLAIISGLANLEVKTNVIGIIPCVENMPSSSAYRPGDIVRMYNGKTVEVINTDAEGRLILADSIAYGVEKYNPHSIIDLATLTGACIVALGSNIAGALSNNPELFDKLRQISEKTNEKFWELPLYPEFNEQIKSKYADIKNIGGRAGGTITAAIFLSNFVNETPWIHLDIAGTAWTQDGTWEKSYNPKGATGFGIRSLIRLVLGESDPK